MSKQNNNVLLIDEAKKSLIEYGVFKTHKNKVVEQMVSLLDANTPQHMAEGIAIYSMAKMINALKIGIEIKCGEIIPASVILFVLAKSGSNKTSSVRITTDALKDGFDIIENKRGMLQSEEEKDAKIPLQEIQSELGTGPGLIKAMNKFQSGFYGAPAIFVDEVASEFGSNDYLEENLAIIAKAFDVGDVPSRMMKTSEAQSQPVKGVPVTALFIGSEYQMTKDEKLIKKLDEEMRSKFSRRAFFIYPKFSENFKTISSMDNFVKNELEDINKNEKMRDELRQIAGKVAYYYTDIGRDDKISTRLSEDVKKLWITYRAYNEEKALHIVDEKLSLEQKDRHWRALKLAGIFSAFKIEEVMSIETYLEAISFTESVAGYSIDFSTITSLYNHDKLVSFCLIKKRFPAFYEIKEMMIADDTRELNEVIKLANSKMEKHEQGRIVVGNESEVISYLSQEEWIHSNEEKIKIIVPEIESIDKVFNISYAIGTPTKASNKYIVDGFKVASFDSFNKVSKLLSQNRVYTIHKLKGSRISSEKIGGTRLLIFDIDETKISIHEMHKKLSEYNHVIATTSDSSNLFKYRIIMEANIEYDISKQHWQGFMDIISGQLGIEDNDNLKKDQKYYCYADTVLLENINGKSVQVSDIQLEFPDKEEKQLKLEIKELLPPNKQSEWYKNLMSIAKKWLRENDFHTHQKYYGLGINCLVKGYSLDVTMQIVDEVMRQNEDSFRTGYNLRGYLKNRIERENEDD